MNGEAKARQSLHPEPQPALNSGRPRDGAVSTPRRGADEISWGFSVGGIYTMFDDLLESTIVKKKTNKGWSVILSGTVQAVILAILILIPLIYTEALPKAMLSTLLIAPPPPPPPPPPPAAVKTVVKPVARLIQSGKLMQPRAIPKEVAVFKEAELPPDIINNNNQGGVFGGLAGQGTVFGSAGPAAPPPPPKAATPSRIKQGGQVTAAS